MGRLKNEEGIRYIFTERVIKLWGDWSMKLFMAPYLSSELSIEGLMCLLIHHPCFLLDIAVVIGCF